MASTQKAEKRSRKASSNVNAAKVTAEQGAGLWKLFPVLTVFVGIVVGILWDQPAMDGAVGEAKTGSSKEGGEKHSLLAGELYCAAPAVLFFVDKQQQSVLFFSSFCSERSKLSAAFAGRWLNCPYK